MKSESMVTFAVGVIAGYVGGILTCPKRRSYATPRKYYNTHPEREPKASRKERED